MNPRLVLLIFLWFLPGCVHQEKEEAAGSPSVGVYGAAPSKDPLHWIAIMPFDGKERGMLVIWEESNRSLIRPALKGDGAGDALRFCSVRIYNFSDEPLSLPDFGEGALSVVSAAGTHPLFPLSRFKDAFYYPGTLELMDRNLEGTLSGRSWIHAELACRAGENGDPGPPLHLVSGSGDRAPWFQVEAKRVLELIRAPTFERLMDLAGSR